MTPERDTGVVEIWTDGRVSRQHGPGAWAAVLRCGPHEKQVFGKEPETTNQRMEMLAAVKGLQALKVPSKVRLYSHSAYLVDTMTQGRLEKWKRNGWKNASGEPVKNVALWEVLEEAAAPHEVEWVKVEAHSENEGNNLADALCYVVARGAELGEESA